MSAPDPGLTELIAAHRPLSQDILKKGLRYRCSCGWAQDVEWGDDSPFPAHVALVVEQHTNGRIAGVEQWVGTRASIEEIAQWANANDDLMDDFTLEYSFTTGIDVFDVRIATQNGDEVVSSGDWIIRDTEGEFHLCRTVRAALEGEQQ